MRRGLPAVALVAAAGLTIGAGGCGEEAEEAPASLVPGEVAVYLEAVVRPEGDQAEAVDTALSRLLATDDPGATITGALDRELVAEDAGITYTADVEEWLGERAGLFFTSFEDDGQGAFVVETTDPDAAEATVDRAIEAEGEKSSDAEYDGVSYTVIDPSGEESATAVGLVDDFLVVGSESGFQDAVDASGGDSFADTDAYGDEFDGLGDESLAAAYADPAGVLDELESTGEIDADQRQRIEAEAGLDLEAPLLADLGANADEVSFEVTAGRGEGSTVAAAELVEGLPADAWFAFGGANAGEALSANLDRATAAREAAAQLAPLEDAVRSELGLGVEELLGWMGDVAVFVGGTSIFDLSAAAVIETTDPEASSAAIERLETVLGREPSLEVTPLTGEAEGEGFEVTVPGAPISVPVVQRDERVVVGLGEASVEEALAPDETLGESESFGGAIDSLGEEYAPALLLDFDPMLELFESTGQAGLDPDYEQAKPYLDHLDFFAAGVNTSDDRSGARLVLGLQEEEPQGTAAALAP